MVGRGDSAGPKLLSVAVESTQRRALMKTVSIFRKSEAKRSEEEVKAATKFLARHQFELRFFRNKQRSRLEQLCRVMGAILVKPGAVLFEQGDLASHVYVVIDGAVGVYIPEDVEEQTEYDTYLQKLRIVTLAGRVADNLRAQEAALDAAKASANIPSATSLASPTGKGDETKRVNLAFREELSPAVANVDVENDPTELDWDADVDVSRSPTAKGKGKLSGMTKKQKWLWAFKRILIGIRAGKFVETLLSRFKVHNGKRLVQVKLVRKGNPFGDLDLFHPSRLRAASAFAKSRCVLFTIPKETFVAMKASEEKSGDLTDDVRFLSTLPWLKGVHQDTIVRMALRCHKREHVKGTVLIAEGSTDLAICCVVDGTVRVVCHGRNDPPSAVAEKSKTSPTSATTTVAQPSFVLPQGRTYTVYQVGLIGPGQWFGEKPILTGGMPNDFGFIADTSVSLLVIPVRAFFPLRKVCHAPLMDHLLTVLAHRADRLVKLIASAKRNEAAALAISSRAHSSSLVVSSSVTKSAVASPEDSVGIRPHRLVVGDVSSVHSLSVNVPELSQASLDTANSSFIIKPRNAGIPLRVTSPLRASVPATTPISSVRRLGSAGSVSQQSSLMTSSHQIPITRLPSRHGSVSPTAADSELEASLSVWSLSESSSLEVPLSSRAPAFIQPTSRRSPSPPPQYPTLSARGPVSSMPASLNAVHLGRSPTLTDRVLLTSPITQPKKPLPSSSTSGVRLPSLQSPSLYQPDASISSQYSTMGYNSEGFVGAGRSPIKRPVTSPEKSSPMASLPVFRKKIESPKAMVWRSSALAPVAATSPKTFSTGDIRELYRAAQLKKQ